MAFVACSLAAIQGGAVSGQVIRLEKQLIVEPHQDVRLGDIATVTGVDRKTAEELSNTMILANVETERNLKAESVLMALISQLGPSALGSGLQVSGSAQCAITVADHIPAPASEATPQAAVVQRVVEIAAPAAASATPPPQRHSRRAGRMRPRWPSSSRPGSSRSWRRRLRMCGSPSTRSIPCCDPRWPLAESGSAAR